jgi:hypothetical protein
MKVMDQVECPGQSDHQADPDPFLPLVLGRPTGNGSPTLGGEVVVGELIGMTNEGQTPLVVYPGQTGSAAIVARSVLDLHSAHIGKQVVLVFEGADPCRPIIMGILRDGQASAPTSPVDVQVQVEADGERTIVRAKEQLVLRCGKASVTLTKAGKILIDGTYVLSRSSGVNRVKGGSIQLN